MSAARSTAPGSYPARHRRCLAEIITRSIPSWACATSPYGGTAIGICVTKVSSHGTTGTYACPREDYERLLPRLALLGDRVLHRVPGLAPNYPISFGVLERRAPVRLEM